MAVVLDPETVAGRGFRPPGDFAPHRALTMVRVVIPEFGRLVPAFPLAFLDDGARAPLVAVLGVEEGRNLYVSNEGRWLGSYVPARIRSHPFCLEAVAGEGPRLAIEESADVLREGPGTRPLFDADGAPSDFHREMRAFLARLEACQAVVDRATAALRRLDLLEPWPIGLDFADGQRDMPDFLRVREAGLVELSDAAFLELRAAQALQLAYAQIFSMRNLALLGVLWRLRGEGAGDRRVPPFGPELDDGGAHFDFIDLAELPPPGDGRRG